MDVYFNFYLKLLFYLSSVHFFSHIYVKKCESDMAVYVSTNLIKATRPVFYLTASDYYPRNYLCRAEHCRNNDYLSYRDFNISLPYK